MPATEGTLRSTLDAFRDSVNAHPQLRRLLKGWEPVIVLRARDTGGAYSLVVQETRIESIREDAHGGDHTVTLQADEATLTRIFAGQMNPARAYLDGVLEVFATDRDQVKLDAISLILWGV